MPGMADETAAPDAAPAEPGDAATTRGFRIPQIFAEGIPTVDGRMARIGAVTFRDAPLPLMAMFTSDHGGEAGPSVFVGNIEQVTRSDAGVWSGTGTFDDFAANSDAAECYRLVNERRLNGVSVDMAVEEFEFEITGIDEEGQPTGEMFVITKGTVVGATVVPMPAQTGCAIETTDGTATDTPAPDAPAEPVAASGPLRMNVILEDGCLPCQDRAADTVTAAGGPVAPPAAWFADPQLDGLTPLTVTDDGRVFGHLAAWGACHIGIGNACVQPPRGGDYSLFATGVIRTQEGTDVPVGQVTLAGGHADLRLGARAAIAHYDDTRSALADVAVGEDEYGPWVAGALRPGVTDEDLRAFRASPPSGDWRPIGGALKLVAACSVNVQGFPIPRVRARVASGSTVALIAGGVLATDGTSSPVGSVGAALDPQVVTELHAWAREREAERLLARIDRA
jgi:hypothetical protein